MITGGTGLAPTADIKPTPLKKAIKRTQMPAKALDRVKRKPFSYEGGSDEEGSSSGSIVDAGPSLKDSKKRPMKRGGKRSKSAKEVKEEKVASAVTRLYPAPPPSKVPV